METSAKSGINATEIFVAVARNLPQPDVSKSSGNGNGNGESPSFWRRGRRGRTLLRANDESDSEIGNKASACCQ